jgi:transcriptional regulator with XRE-family HTH domain
VITNDVQYRTAKAQVDRLQNLADDLGQRPSTSDDDELLRELETAAVEGQMTELRGQISEYDGLREGRTAVGVLSSLDDLPTLLVRARIASGLSQRGLAERLGLKEQQIQRYESSGYASASLARLREVAGAVGLTESAQVGDGVDGATVIKELTRLGLDRTFIRRRIAPAALREGPAPTQGAIAPVIDLASRVGRVFGVDGSTLLTGGDINLDDLALAASFKLPANTSRKRVAAYTVYAHYLALLTLQATEHVPVRPLPKDSEEFRAEWSRSSSGLGFAGLLTFVWSLGIPVLPLADPGGFHAAVWRAHDRNVVVLKQGARHSSRWAFDLLHEVGHVIGGWDEDEAGVVDDDEMRADEVETAANQFAGQVLLNGRAEELAQKCVAQTSGSVERLKKVVPSVAVAAGVDVAALANYMAFRLSLQDVNWWGAATNLQSSDEDPWGTTRDAFIARTNLGVLNPLDRELLNQALVQ